MALWLAGAGLAAVVGGCGGSSDGGGNTITVDTLADDVDSGACSLREAISMANGFPIHGSNCRTPSGGAARIVFASGLSGSIALGGQLPPIRGELTIEGPGGDAIIVSGEGLFRVFDVEVDAEVEISGLVIANGNARETTGGSGLRNAGTTTLSDCILVNNFSSLDGGGILNVGVGALAIIDSSLLDNRSSSVGGALHALSGNVEIEDSTFAGNNNGDGAGGAVAVSGAANLTVVGSTFLGNSSAGNGGGGAIAAAGIVYIENSTFSENFANAPGGALAVQPGGEVIVVASTFQGNLAAPQFAGSALVIADGGTLTTKSTLFARATDMFNPICLRANNGSLVNDGYNIAADSSCGFGTSVGASGQTLGDGVDPLLSPTGLADNGGPTDTVALLDDSPAIAAIPPADCTDGGGEPLTTDQRGEPRPRQQPCDIGAYETQ